jgi:hypothetical protein
MKLTFDIVIAREPHQVSTVASFHKRRRQIRRLCCTEKGETGK